MKRTRFLMVLALAVCMLLTTNTASAQRSSPISNDTTTNVPILGLYDDAGNILIFTEETGAVESQPEPARTSGATANRNSNLRGGPGTSYPIVGHARAGQALTPVGRNADGSWYLLEGDVWIAAFLVNNAPGGLPVVQASSAKAPAPMPEASAPAAQAAPAPAEDSSLFPEDPATMVQEATAYIAQNPGDATAYGLRGIAFYELGNYGSALADLNTALRLNPGLLEAYVFRGMIYIDRGNYASAISDFSVYLQIYQTAEVYASRGFAYAFAGNDAQAIQDMERALQLGLSGEMRTEVENALGLLRGF